MHVKNWIIKLPLRSVAYSTTIFSHYRHLLNILFESTITKDVFQQHFIYIYTFSTYISVLVSLNIILHLSQLSM